MSTTAPVGTRSPERSSGIVAFQRRSGDSSSLASATDLVAKYADFIWPLGDLHPSNVATLLGMSADPNANRRRALADSRAISVLDRYRAERSLFELQRLIDGAALDILAARYEQVELRGAELPRARDTVALILGCQTGPILDARIYACAQVVATAQKPVSILPSGGNPGGIGKRAQIPNESLYIERGLQAALRDMGVSFAEVAQFLPRDSASRDTQENLDNSLRIIARALQGRQCDLLLATSPWHLPRAAKHLEDLIEVNEASISRLFLLPGILDRSAPADARYAYLRSGAFESLEILLNLWMADPDPGRLQRRAA